MEERYIGVAEVGPVDVERKMNDVYLMEKQLDSTSTVVVTSQSKGLREDPTLVNQKT